MYVVIICGHDFIWSEKFETEKAAKECADHVMAEGYFSVVISDVPGYEHTRQRLKREKMEKMAHTGRKIDAQ
jgi:hypothetical protein